MSANSDDQRQRFAELEQRMSELEAENEQLREQLSGTDVSRRGVLGALAGAGGAAMLGSGAMSQSASAAMWSDGDSDGLLETGSQGIDVGEVKTDKINSITHINKDDTEADIQQKIDDSGSYSMIEFGEGTWDITSGLTVNHDHIVLRGGRESLLQIPPETNLTGSLLSGTGDNITIDGLRFLGHGDSQPDPSASAISLDGKRITVRNCEIRNFWVTDMVYGHGIHIESSGYAKIHDNRIWDVGRNCVEIQPLGSSPRGGDLVANNVMGRTDESPVNPDLNDDTDAYQAYGVLSKVSGTTIRNNVIDWSQAPANDIARLFSVVLYDGYASIVGNYMKDSIGEQIYANHDPDKRPVEHVLVAGNEIHGAREDPASQPISYTALGANSAFVNNYVTEHKDHGVVADGKNVLVANNLFEDNDNDIHMKKANGTVTGNHAVGTKRDSITVDAKRTLVSNNLLSSTVAKGNSGHAIRVRTDTGQAFITSNWIDFYYGIYGYDSSEMWVSNNMLECDDTYETYDFNGNSTINRQNNWSL